MAAAKKLYIENRLPVPVFVFLKPNDDGSLMFRLYAKPFGTAERIDSGKTSTYDLVGPLGACVQEDPVKGKYFVSLDFKVKGDIEPRAELLLGRNKREGGPIFEIVPFVH